MCIRDRRKLFFKLRSSKKRLGWLNHDEVNTVARELGVSADNVMEMEARLSSHDAVSYTHLDVYKRQAQAIFAEDDLPADQQQFLALNADLAKQWPVITTKEDAPPDADDWNGKPDKLQYLEH